MLAKGRKYFKTLFSLEENTIKLFNVVTKEKINLKDVEICEDDSNEAKIFAKSTGKSRQVAD